MRKYVEVTDAVGQNPKTVKELESVAISTELSVLKQNEFGQWQKKGWHQTGDTKIVGLQLTSMSLDNSAPDKGKVPTAEFQVCVDVSDVDVVDRSGKSVITDARADQWTTKYGVANYSWKTDPQNGWRVAWSEDVPGGKSCE